MSLAALTTAGFPPLIRTGTEERRNFQPFCAADFLAEVTQRLSEKRAQLVRDGGRYAHRQRGMRAKSRTPDDSDAPRETLPLVRSQRDARTLAGDGPPSGFVSTRALWIRRVDEADPLECPECGGTMTSIGLAERSEGGDGVARIPRDCRLGQGPRRTRASDRAPPRSCRRAARAPNALQLVLDGASLDSERPEAQPSESRELPWGLDPEFLLAVAVWPSPLRRENRPD